MFLFPRPILALRTSSSSPQLRTRVPISASLNRFGPFGSVSRRLANVAGVWPIPFSSLAVCCSTVAGCECYQSVLRVVAIVGECRYISSLGPESPFCRCEKAKVGTCSPSLLPSPLLRLQISSRPSLVVRCNVGVNDWSLVHSPST